MSLLVIGITKDVQALYQFVKVTPIYDLAKHVADTINALMCQDAGEKLLSFHEFMLDAGVYDLFEPCDCGCAYDLEKSSCLANEARHSISVAIYHLIRVHDVASVIEAYCKISDYYHNLQSELRRQICEFVKSRAILDDNQSKIFNILFLYLRGQVYDMHDILVTPLVLDIYLSIERDPVEIFTMCMEARKWLCVDFADSVHSLGDDWHFISKTINRARTPNPSIVVRYLVEKYCHIPGREPIWFQDLLHLIWVKGIVVYDYDMKILRGVSCTM